MREATSEAKRKKLAKRLKVVEAFRESGNRPSG
jgi:DNA-directed RNA polymerase subunit beta'